MTVYIFPPFNIVYPPFILVFIFPSITDSVLTRN